MNNLKFAAGGVHGRMTSQGFTFDPTIILVIIELISALLPMLLDLCDKTPETASAACTDILLQKGMAYRVARRACRRRIGYFEFYQAGGDQMLDAILQEGVNAPPELVSRCYCEIKAAG